MSATVVVVEGVPYRRYVVRYVLADGRSRRRVLWSPGLPWLGEEVDRMLLHLHGPDGVRAGSNVRVSREDLCVECARDD